MSISNPDLSHTRSFIAEDIERGLCLGGQLYVSVSGRVVARAAFGENKPGAPLSTDTLMLWLSAGKPITAVAIAQLWEQEALKLDDLVTRFIPEFGQGGKERITIHHLLTHTGGFRGADLTLHEDVDWDAVIACICASPLEPRWLVGKKAGYHLASSWYVLAEIVQRLDGRSFDRYVREMIFEPLGMLDSWMGLPPSEYRRYGERLGWIYTTDKGSVEPHPFWNSARGCALCQPGCNVRAPVNNISRFYEWLLEAYACGTNQGERVLRRETVRALTSRVRTGMFDHTFRHVIDFGLGFIVDSNRYGAETVPYGYGRHCSESAFGHSGSQCSCAFADPGNGLTVAWVFNGRPGEAAHQRRARELNSAIYKDLGLGGAVQAR